MSQNSKKKNIHTTIATLVAEWLDFGRVDAT